MAKTQDVTYASDTPVAKQPPVNAAGENTYVKARVEANAKADAGK